MNALSVRKVASSASPEIAWEMPSIKVLPLSETAFCSSGFTEPCSMPRLLSHFSTSSRA